MEVYMDRRQRKTRESIFRAFSSLLSEKNISKITVEEIIREADVGRATFYSHFETKDYLVREFCNELFCHIFDSMREEEQNHHHIFQCDAPDSVFLHLFMHIKKNDNHILELLSCENNQLFLNYFKEGLLKLAESQVETTINAKVGDVPRDFLINHIASTFVQTVDWWVKNNMTQSPEEINEYFISVLS